jgi:hypothetical protein
LLLYYTGLFWQAITIYLQATKTLSLKILMETLRGPGSYLQKNSCKKVLQTSHVSRTG